MTIHIKCDNPTCVDPNREIRATVLDDLGLYTSISGRIWRKTTREFIDGPMASGVFYWRRARTDDLIDATPGIEEDYFASSEACADAIDVLYPEA